MQARATLEYVLQLEIQDKEQALAKLQAQVCYHDGHTVLIDQATLFNLACALIRMRIKRQLCHITHAQVQALDQHLIQAAQQLVGSEGTADGRNEQGGAPDVHMTEQL